MSNVKTEIDVAKSGVQPVLLSHNGEESAFASQSNEQGWEWVKLRKIARKQIDKFISLVPETLRDGNLEAVNKMRVTSRRLEQILDLLYPRPRPRRIKKLRKQLKACRHTLGALRNYDALLLMVEESLSGKPAADSAVWNALKDYLQHRRVENARETLEKFGRMNLTSSYLKLRRDLDEDSLAQVAGKDPQGNGGSNGGDDLSRRIIESLDNRWQAFEHAVEKSRRDPREEVIHRMRIAAKRLRYLTEAMEKLHIERSAETLAWLRTLQQIVGLWHDRELLEHAMADMLAQPRFKDGHPGLAAEVQRVIHHNHVIKQQLEKKFSWMTNHSRHYHGTREWVSQLLANGNGNGNGNGSGNGLLLPQHT